MQASASVQWCRGLPDFGSRGPDKRKPQIEKGFEDDRTQSWRGVLKAKLEKLYEDEHSGDLRDSVPEYVQESVKGDEDEDE